VTPFGIIELVLRIILLAMEGQTPEQRAKMWDMYIRDVEAWRKFLKIDG
jgi:hypothetical protein